MKLNSQIKNNLNFDDCVNKKKFTYIFFIVEFARILENSDKMHVSGIN